MSKTKIDWCDEVWNPVWGCYNTCRYCYARRIAKRFGKTDAEIAFNPAWIEKNYLRKFAKSSRYIFVNSMSDVQYWQEEWWIRVLHRIRQLPDLTFIFLTKGHPASVYGNRNYPVNVILGVTVTGEYPVDIVPFVMMDTLKKQVRWLLNIEPLHGEILLSARDFDWIIIGAETGNSQYKISPQFGWVHGIINEAVRLGKSVFFKDTMKDLVAAAGYPFLRQFPRLTGGGK